MKAKALRFKDTKEYVAIQFFGKEMVVGSCDLPTIQPTTATISGMRNIYFDEILEGKLDIDNMEFVVLDVIESGEVGADIRNKLGNYSNLVQLVELFLEEKDRALKKKLKKLIRKEIVLGNETVKYLAELL